MVVPAGRLRAYGKAAIERNRAKLASEKGGNRNNTLNDCAFALGQLAPAGITNEDECREVLYEAARACGMDFVEDGVRGTFNSGWRAGMRQPFWPDWAEEDPETEYPLREWSEFGLGDRMVDRFADTLRWAPIANRWMTWQSGRWEMDSKEAGEWLARPMIEAMLTDEEQYYPGESEKEGEKSPRAAFRDWAKGKRNHKSMAGAASVAKANALMRIDLNACDADPMMINLRNGVLNAGTSPFSFHEHDPDQLLTMRGGVAYDPTAACPLWDAFLAQVQTAEDMRQYLYRCWGYSLTADFSEQAVFLNHGGGANGKWVALDVLSMIIGDYAQVVPIETLLTSKNKQGRIPNDVARMKGKRFLKCSETMEGRRLDEALIKQLTGGEEVVARFMRAEYFEFRMLGKVHLTSQHPGPRRRRGRHLAPGAPDPVDGHDPQARAGQVPGQAAVRDGGPGHPQQAAGRPGRLAGQEGLLPPPPRWTRSMPTGSRRTPWARRSTSCSRSTRSTPSAVRAVRTSWHAPGPSSTRSTGAGLARSR